MQQKLTVPRGTSFQFLVTLADPLGEDKTLEEGDTLIFGVKHFPEHKNCLFTKTLDSSDYRKALNGYVFSITPEDTQDFLFDTYWYDISVQTAGGDFYKVVDTSQFVVDKMITRKVVTDGTDTSN